MALLSKYLNGTDLENTQSTFATHPKNTVILDKEKESHQNFLSEEI